VDDSPEPARECRVVAELMQVTEGIDERLLARVLGQSRIAQEREGVSVRHGLETLHQLAERARITASRSVDQASDGRKHRHHHFYV